MLIWLEKDGSLLVLFKYSDVFRILFALYIYQVSSTYFCKMSKVSAQRPVFKNADSA